MRHALLLVLVLAGCADEPEANDVPQVADDGWQVFPVFNTFRLALPPAWTKDVRLAGAHGYAYYGPKDDAFLPNVHLYWHVWSKSETEFFQFERRRRVPEGPQRSKILDEGAAEVAGVNGWFLVYEQYSRVANAPPLRFRTIDFYFVRNGYAGILRGVATAETFDDRYRAFFTRVKDRLQFAR